MIAIATGIVGTVAELVIGVNAAMVDWFTEIGDTLVSWIGLPPRRGSWRWLESAEGISERWEWERIKAARAEWEMIPDRIEIAGQFTNLPEGTTAADLAHWSADGLTDKLQDIGTSFYALSTRPIDEWEAALLQARAEDSRRPILMPIDAEPSVTVRCQYCQVGGQDPDGGVCGRCGAPFPAPEFPRRLGTYLAQGVDHA